MIHEDFLDGNMIDTGIDKIGEYISGSTYVISYYTVKFERHAKKMEALLLRWMKPTHYLISSNATQHYYTLHSTTHNTVRTYRQDG